MSHIPLIYLTFILGISYINISTFFQIYHSFHDEVDVYRQHWWRCNGPCQNRKPYFGFVKRAMNRAPSHLDPWWEDHRRTCGGTYTKVKEPEGYGKKKRDKKDKAAPSSSNSGNEKPESSKPSSSGDLASLAFIILCLCLYRDGKVYRFAPILRKRF